MRWVAAKAGVSRDGAKMVWASVSCKEGARPNSLGRSRGCGRGGHGGQSAGATWTDEDIDEVVEGITDWERAWPGGVWCLENPRDSEVHSHPAVLQAWGERRDVRRVEARGCCYGLDMQKPYLIWTTLTQEEWTPRDWRVVCKACKENTRHRVQWAPRPGSGGTRLTAKDGFTLDAMKNRVPPELAEEIGAAMVAAVESRERTLRQQKRP